MQKMYEAPLMEVVAFATREAIAYGEVAGDATELEPTVDPSGINP